MVNIQYAGPKPIISCSGIGFEAKLDKFEFIEPASRVLNMFINLHSKIVTEQIRPSDPLKEEEILIILRRAFEDFDSFHDEQLQVYNDYLDKEEDEAKNRSDLSDLEREALIKNLKFMRDYRLQRASNKIVYEAIINRSVELLRSKEICRVKTPFSTNYLHALGSLESTLHLEKVAPSTKLEVKLDGKKPYAELLVEFS